MKKVYLVSDDEYSGKVVIVCRTAEVEVNIAKYETQELEAAQYLYRELPEILEKRTKYIIEVFYHYELGEYAYIPNGEGATNFLERWSTFDKDEANEYFKQAVLFAK